MSRHRNVRSMNITDEYEGYDDVYGHSVEDDYCISPSDAAFIYDRDASKGQQKIASFLKSDDDIAEEDEMEMVQELDDLDKTKLNSCIENVRTLLSQVKICDQELSSLIVKENFAVEKVVDIILASSKLVPAEPNLEISKEKAAVLSMTQTLEQPDIPSIKVVAPGGKKSNVTKGFDIQQKDNSFRNLTPRSQSPASRGDSPVVDKDKCESNAQAQTGELSAEDARFTKQRENAIAQYQKERSENKQHLYMVVIGHVDAGKSTLMGHLLCALGQVNQRTLHKYEQESRKLGKQSFMYAWVLDETGEERSRGITMDVGKSQFETESKLVTLLDAPGHKDFIPNMISGAGQADVALLVVDATRGEFETGFELGGQTREHALLVRSLGVSQLAVVINKLDTVQWSQERFNEISIKLGAFLKQAGFKDTEVSYVPCSGLTGQNLVQKPTEEGLTDWYKGSTLLEVIDNFRPPDRQITKPFRFTINDVYKGTGSGFCVSGKVETGCLNTGDRVLICPIREQATVKSLALEDTLNCQVVFAGDQVSVTLSGVDIQNVSVGNILCDPQRSVPISTKFEARIVVFNVTVPITKGYSVVLHHQSLVEPAVITKLLAQLHKSSGEILKRRPRCLGNNSTATVEITVPRPMALELYSDCKELGRIMLRVAGVTIAAGLITRIIL